MYNLKLREEQRLADAEQAITSADSTEAKGLAEEAKARAAAKACPSSNALGQSAVFGTEALARLGLRLGGFQLMLQSSQFDGVAFDPFSLQKDGRGSAEVDVGRSQVL